MKFGSVLNYICNRNPIINENVRELYMNIISGEEFDKTSKYKLKKTLTMKLL